MDLTAEEIKKLFKDNPTSVVDTKTLSNTTKFNLGIPSVSPTSKIQDYEVTFFYLDTTFNFGDYKGKTVREVIDLNTSYLDWCALNIKPFYMTEGVIEEIININPELLSSKSREILLEKYSIWVNKEQVERDEDINIAGFSNYDDDLDMDQQSPEFWNQF